MEPRGGVSHSHLTFFWKSILKIFIMIPSENLVKSFHEILKKCVWTQSLENHLLLSFYSGGKTAFHFPAENVSIQIRVHDCLQNACCFPCPQINNPWLHCKICGDRIRAKGGSRNPLRSVISAISRIRQAFSGGSKRTQASIVWFPLKPLLSVTRWRRRKMYRTEDSNWEIHCSFLL